MCSNENPEQIWKSKANASYQKVIDSIITLSTATLVIPTLFLKDYMGIAPGKSLKHELPCIVIDGWILLFASIACCLFYYYTSAKWLKKAYGGKVKWSEDAIDKSLNILFWGAGGTFFVGLLLLLIFIVTYVPHK